jgi:hypothetical protein
MPPKPSLQTGRPPKYVNTYIDRHGKLRCYFRRPGRSAIPLPTPIGTAKFTRAYAAALATAPDVIRRKAATQQRQTETRRLRENSRRLSKSRPATGVYLLLFDGEITYVGSSTNMADRVATHRTNGRPFDQHFFIGTRANERKALEELLIRKLRPRGNIRVLAPNNGREP